MLLVATRVFARKRGQWHQFHFFLFCRTYRSHWEVHSLRKYQKLLTVDFQEPCTWTTDTWQMDIHHPPAIQTFCFAILLLSWDWLIVWCIFLEHFSTCSVKWPRLHQTWWSSSAAWDSVVYDWNMSVKNIASWPNEVVHLRVQHNNKTDYSKEIKGRRHTTAVGQKASCYTSPIQNRGLWHLVLRQSSLFTRAERKWLKDMRKSLKFSCVRKWWSESSQEEMVEQDGEDRTRTTIIKDEGKQRKEAGSGVRFLSRVTGGFALRYRERSSALRRTVIFEA